MNISLLAQKFVAIFWDKRTNSTIRLIVPPTQEIVKMKTRTVLLAAAMLLVSVIRAQAQQLEVAVKPSDFSFTATPLPAPTVNPAKPVDTPPETKKEETKVTPVTPTDYSWMWLVIGIILVLSVIGFFVWTRTRKPKEEKPVPADTIHEPNPDDHDGPRYPNNAKVDWPDGPRPTPLKEHAHVSAWTPVQNEIEVVPSPATPAETTVIEGQDVPSTEDLEPSTSPADDTDPKGSGPKTVALFILALGLSFAQAGMASAQCKIDEIKLGQKIVQEQAPIFVEIQTSGCKNPTGLGIRASGFDITQFKFHPESGRITALVSADATSEKGKLEFKIFDGMEVRSTDKTFFLVYPTYAGMLHNDVDRVKTSVTNLTGELRTGVATLNGRVDGLKTETDKVRAEVKAKADNARTQAEIDQLRSDNSKFKSDLEMMRGELDQTKKTVSGMSKSIYDNTVANSNAFELIGNLASQTKRSWFLGKKKETNKPVAVTAERLRKLNATRAAALKKAKPEVSDHDDSER